MTEEEKFLEKQGGTFHIRLLLYYNEYASEEEKEKQEETDILFFELEEGRYSIRYGDLKKRADEETIAYVENNGGDINKLLNNED